MLTPFASILWQLASSADAKSLIVQSGSIPALVTLLQKSVGASAAPAAAADAATEAAATEAAEPSTESAALATRETAVLAGATRARAR